MWRRILKGTKTSDRWEAQSELRDEINRIQDLVEAERRAQGLMAGAAAAWNEFYPSVQGKYFIASDYFARARKGSAVLRAIVVRPDEDTEEDSFGIATIPPSDSSDCRYDYIAEHARSLPSSATSGRGGGATEAFYDLCDALRNREQVGKSKHKHQSLKRNNANSSDAGARKSNRTEVPVSRWASDARHQSASSDESGSQSRDSDSGSSHS
jgi:hypothetical protein